MARINVYIHFHSREITMTLRQRQKILKASKEEMETHESQGNLAEENNPYLEMETCCVQNLKFEQSK